jgi:hypothetical protein
MQVEESCSGMLWSNGKDLLARSRKDLTRRSQHDDDDDGDDRFVDTFFVDTFFLPCKRNEATNSRGFSLREPESIHYDTWLSERDG